MSHKIMVMDDEESIRFTFQSFLKRSGYEVIAFENLTDAANALDDYRPDLIFADIILGGDKGTRIISEVKARNWSCPVVMITGRPNIETASDAVRLGAFDYLPKPVRKETLLRVTEMALQHKRLVDEREAIRMENVRYRKHLEAVFRSVRDAIITVDNEGRVTDANEAVRDILDADPAGIVGRSLLDREAPPDAGVGSARPALNNACRTIVSRTLENGERIDEHHVACRDGDRSNQGSGEAATSGGSAEVATSARMLTLSCAPLVDDNGAAIGAVLVIRDVTRLSALERELKERGSFQRIIGKSKKMQDIYRLLEELAETESNVLVTGESGTGKELIAQALHGGGGRAKRPLVSVNCSALSENLLESELFGHVRGAFTGAVKDKKGRFELADGGTILLDEIGDISPLIQLKLLRVLQERTFERVGDPTPVRVDVRVIAATHRDLREMVRRGEFREDLFYRLKVLEIVLPPLRERPEDIPLLVDHFRRRFNARFMKAIRGVSDEVLRLFLGYAWPGNIRELENALEHAFVLCHDPVIAINHLPSEIRDQVTQVLMPAPSPSEGEVSAEAVRQALDRCGWNKAKAARLLGVSRQTLYRKLERFDIVTPPSQGESLS